MATVNATPLSQRNSHSPFDDTPTRAPSSGHSSLNTLTSLKPQRSHPSLAHHARNKLGSFSGFAATQAAGQGLRTASVNTLDHTRNPHSRTASRLSKASDFPDDLLGDAIEADNTEIARRRVEASFQRQLDSLANAALSVSSASDIDDGHQPARRRFDDESRSTRSSASRSSADSLGSLRIGLTGSAPIAAGTTARGVTIEDVDEDDDTDDHLTYVTERTSVLNSPARPFASPAAPTAARSPVRAPGPAATSGGLFGSPRASVRSHMQASPQRRASPAPANENLPPSPAATARPSPSAGFTAARASPYPSVAPPRTVVPPLSSFARSPFSAAAPVAAAYAPKAFSPLNPALNSPVNASPSQSTIHTRAFSPTEERDYAAADRTARTALPDRTGLTEMLRSPAARRAPPAQPARRTSPAGSGSGSGRSAEANLVSTALSGLTAKLAALERDNAASAARVAELEARLAQRGERDDAQERERARRVREEVEALLGEERERRAELERVVGSLRAQNAHLDATLSAQHATLSSLRSVPAPAPAKAAPERGYALRSEVQDLKHALAALGYEVDGVRTVVEELLREKEARDAARRWDAEEGERRESLRAGAQEQRGSAPGTPGERTSFVAEEEVEILRREQEEELQRRTARGASKKPAHRAPSYDSTYVPSDDAGSHSSGSLVTATSATSVASSTSVSVVDEPDFARAQRIFESVSPPRRSRRAAAAKKAQGRDRVVLLDEPSANLCANCHGRKSALRSATAAHPHHHGDGADADEEDLAPGEEARVRAKRERRARKEVERVRAEERKEEARREEKLRRARERKEREEHRRTLEGVLDRLEGDFAAQKKIYLELTAEYHGMASRAETHKRRALAAHLKQSIDVLEDKAREVKRYADALEDLYETVHEQTCPRRKAHGVV
ncbi:hypothetical protein JCM10449v2_004298 [Rhodotorula kratochvilovae]